MTALRSDTYLAGSRDAPCTLRIDGCSDRDTVVPCHLTDSHTGRSIKASDLSVADGCFRCHEILDGRAGFSDGHIITDAEWRFYALRGLQETLERRKDMGLIIVAGDAELQPRKEPKPAVRKPPAERKKIGGRTEIQQRPKKAAQPQRRATGPIIHKSDRPAEEQAQ